jgi:hypothetical protein
MSNAKSGFNERRDFFSLSTRTALSAAAVIAGAKERCDQEKNIEPLQTGGNAMRRPVYDLVSIWAYRVMAPLDWNSKSWFAMTRAFAWSFDGF